MKKLPVLLVAVTSIIALGACSTDNPSSSKTNDSSSQTSGSGTKPVQFSFWYTVGQGLQEGIAEKAEEFTQLIKQNEDVDVEISLEYQGGYSDIKTKIEAGLGTGNLPSLAVAYPDHVATYLSYESEKAKYVVNLDKFIDNPSVGFGTESYLGDDGATEDDIVEAFFKEGQCYAKEGTYSLPWMKSSEIMFYNLSAVKRCFGIGAGEGADSFDSSVKTEEQVINFVNNMSWETMINLGRFAVEHKATILPKMVAPIMYDSDSNLFISKMYQEEIPYASIGEDGKGVIDFESGENRSRAEALLSEYAQNVSDGILTTKILQEGKYSSSLFVEEKLIFAIGSSGGTGYNSPDAATFDYKIAKVPASNNNPLYITQGPTLTIINNPADSVATQEVKALYAWKFLKYLTNTEVNTDLCISDSQGYIPMRESAYNTEYFAAFLEEPTIYSEAANVLLNDVSGNYIASDTFNGSADLRDQVGNILASIAGGTSVSEAFSNAINEAKKKF